MFWWNVFLSVVWYISRKLKYKNNLTWGTCQLFIPYTLLHIICSTSFDLNHMTLFILLRVYIFLRYFRYVFLFYTIHKKMWRIIHLRWNISLELKRNNEEYSVSNSCDNWVFCPQCAICDLMIEKHQIINDLRACS